MVGEGVRGGSPESSYCDRRNGSLMMLSQLGDEEGRAI